MELYTVTARGVGALASVLDDCDVSEWEGWDDADYDDYADSDELPPDWI